MAAVRFEAWLHHAIYIWNFFAVRTGKKIDVKMLSFSPLFKSTRNGMVTTSNQTIQCTFSSSLPPSLLLRH